MWEPYGSQGAYNGDLAREMIVNKDWLNFHCLITFSLPQGKLQARFSSSQHLDQLRTKVLDLYKNNLTLRFFKTKA